MLYYTYYIVLHTKGWWKFSLADIKKILCRSDLWSKLSCVSCAAWNVFPINSLLTAYCPKIYTVANNLWLLPYEWHFFYKARPLYFSHLAKNILEVIIFGNSILLVEPYNPLQWMKTSIDHQIFHKIFNCWW